MFSRVDPKSVERELAGDRCAVFRFTETVGRLTVKYCEDEYKVTSQHRVDPALVAHDVTLVSANVTQCLGMCLAVADVIDAQATCSALDYDESSKRCLLYLR